MTHAARILVLLSVAFYSSLKAAGAPALVELPEGALCMLEEPATQVAQAPSGLRQRVGLYWKSLTKKQRLAVLGVVSLLSLWAGSALAEHLSDDGYRLPQALDCAGVGDVNPDQSGRLPASLEGRCAADRRVRGLLEPRAGASDLDLEKYYACKTSANGACRYDAYGRNLDAFKGRASMALPRGVALRPGSALGELVIRAVERRRNEASSAGQLDAFEVLDLLTASGTQAMREFLGAFSPPGGWTNEQFIKVVDIAIDAQQLGCAGVCSKQQQQAFFFNQLSKLRDGKL